MEPITTAALATAVSALATKAAEGFVSEAVKDGWKQIKTIFGWKEEPTADDLAKVEERLDSDSELARAVSETLQSINLGQQLVGNVDAQNVVVANKIDVAGDFKMG